MIRFFGGMFLLGHLNNLTLGAMSLEIGAVMKRRLMQWRVGQSSSRWWQLAVVE
jgi:hypothetical protein